MQSTALITQICGIHQVAHVIWYQARSSWPRYSSLQMAQTSRTDPSSPEDMSS